MNSRSLFEEFEEPVELPTGYRARCTPESLLEFIQETRRRTGKSPTLDDCKHKFGGIIGPLICGWKLQEQGLL